MSVWQPHALLRAATYLTDCCLRLIRKLHGGMTSGSDEILYPRSPILEAVVELRFADIAAPKVLKAASVMKSRYKDRTEELLVEGSLNFEAKSSSFKNLGRKVKLSSSDQTDALHIAERNAVWVRLAPYEGWSAFSARLEYELPKVLKALGDPKITRIGMRYVNRIDFPVRDELGYHEDYLSYRLLGGKILEPHDGYKWTLEKHFPDQGLSAVVQSSTARGEIPDFAAIIFDIDVSVSKDVPSKSDDILSRLCEMRLLKNKIFEEGITDKARELFNGPIA
ncbi:MAG: TIGR04255 family protein [Sphingopyxis sp.]|uniref:TIGR04255 family protein n=1 Tax=Sphingopyxis sp. TaxID=1908224 RepID=UPI001A45E3C1|nr:TIGR04255 family protein [Sphingopyxis sp.]MBL9065485.1 TIGR04255 family protein [Sphingopyxis sp.]